MPRTTGRDCVCPSGMDNFCGHRFDKQYGELPLGYDHKYVYSHFGYNLKISDMQAAIGCAQLKRINDFADRRRANYAKLYEGVKDLEDKFILPKICPSSNPSPFGFMLTCREGVDAFKVVGELEAMGVQTRRLFAGNLIKHPCFDQMRASGEGYRVVGELTNTDRVMNSGFWIGVYPGMTDDMLDYMIECLHKIVK